MALWKVVIEGVDITLKTGGGFIRLTEGGITIVGNIVLINSGGGAGDGAGIAPKAPELPYVEGCLCNTPVYANFVTGWRPELIVYINRAFIRARMTRKWVKPVSYWSCQRNKLA